MFYNVRKEKRGEKTFLCLAAAGPINNENHTVVTGNSSGPSVKENESLAQAAGSFMWGLGIIYFNFYCCWKTQDEKQLFYYLH